VSAWGNVIRSLVATLSRQTARVDRPGSEASVPRTNSSGTRQGDEPGRSGETATIEIDPAAVGKVRMTYVPSTDRDPDPGEIVWTWVPFEERDGRGKDRPVLIVAEEASGTRLAVQLTSRAHEGSRDYIPIGSGPWDSQGRPSWVNVDRVFRLHPAGMRREASAVDKSSFVRVASALRDMYGWR
jgi:hypothetical protein